MKNKKANRLVSSYAAAIGIWLLLSFPAYGQPMNDRLGRFQKFVNGEIPVQEAIVYRTVAKTNGIVFNKQWWRFAYQEGTWYCQQLKPDDSNPTNLIPSAMNGVCGKSYTSFWKINDAIIEVADKNFVRDSHLDYVFERFLMLSALSLNLPRITQAFDIQDSYIEWDNLKYRSIVVSKRDKANKVAKSPIEGWLVLGADGAPILSEHPGVGVFPAGKTHYYYTSLAESIPTEFISTNDVSIVDEKFILLKLGKTDLKKTGGYVPSMFADMKVHRDVAVWTNSKSYYLENGKLVDTSTILTFDNQKKQKGFERLTVSLCVLAAVSAFLTLWRWRMGKNRTADTK